MFLLNLSFSLSGFQALNPFYLFQAYTVILWSIQMYWKFAVIIAITSVLSVTASVWETRRVRRYRTDRLTDNVETFSISLSLFFSISAKSESARQDEIRVYCDCPEEWNP